MKKIPASKSGIFNVRTITACAFFSVAILLTYFSLAASARPAHNLIFNGTSTPTGLTTTITVNSTSPVIANDGMCTLPEAIIAANTHLPSGSLPGECPAGSSGGNVIVLQFGATYTLPAPQNSMYGPNGLPGVTSPIAIVGNGAIIERNSNSPTNFRLFYISPAGSLSLNNLTVRNGIAKGGDGGEGVGGGGGLGAGGAIYNQGGLSLNGVTLTANKASGGNGGNGILGQGAGGGGMGGNGGQTTSGGGFPGSSGGGGMGGNGGDSAGPGGGGGGGLNLTDAGQPSVGPVGGAGGGTTGGAGGNGANLTTSGGNALGVGGGGGGAGNPVAFVVLIANGGNGAIGGGGGGCIVGDAPRVASCQGGQGGFGGGGGSGGRGISGNGGFGGGGGGASAPTGGTAAPGNGGFGGGKGAFDGGGGGGMGGAIFNDTGVVTLFNSTLTGNIAAGGNNGSGLSASVAGDGLGGAIFNLNGSVTIDFSTIVSNTVTGGARGPGGAGTVGQARGGAIYNYTNASSATFSVQDSIIANSVGAPSDCINDPGATLTSNGYNLVRTPGTTCGFAATGDLTGVNPMLAALADNGGPTQTQALQAGSQAIDRIPNGINGCQAGVSVDQRGAPRAGGPGLGGTACDSGAYELDSVPPQNLGGPPGPPTFGHPIISGIGGNGFEQDIRLDPTDPNRVYTSSPGALSSDHSWIWHSRDGGKTFKWVTSGTPLTGKAAACAGGGDTELAVDSAGHLYFADLTLLNFSTARSDDFGASFTCSNTGVPDTVVDRQWYATDGDPTNGGSIYLVNDDAGVGGTACPNPNELVMYRSPAAAAPGTTAGIQFGPPNRITPSTSCDEGIMGNDEVSPVATKTGQPNGLGGFVTLPTAVKHVYVIHDDAGLHQIRLGRCFPVAFGAPTPNVSDPSGLNCTDILVRELGATGVKTGGDFPTLAIDKAGNLYAVWEQAPIDTNGKITGDTVLMYSFSTDEGNTWSTPLQIDTSGSSAGTLHNNVFAWINAGDDGRVNIVWYGTTGLSDPNNNVPLPGHGCGQNAANPPPPQMGTNVNGPDACTGCIWSLWMVQSLNAHDPAPTFTAPILASEHHIHRGTIQTLIGGQCGDRTLGDFLQMRLGPFGEAQISYADSNNIVEGTTPHGIYVRQNGGNGLFAASSPLGIPGLTPFNSVTDPLADAKYEVGGMTSANMPQLDIIGSSVSLLTTAPCSVAAPCYQVVMQLNNLSLAPTTAQDPDPDLVWLTQWLVPSTTDTNGGKNFFVYAESTNGGALTCYYGQNATFAIVGGVAMTYPGANSLDASAGTLPAANCLSTLGPNGTITIDVPLSNVNEPGAIDNHLHEVTASTMTLHQPANAAPSTAGIGGVLFNLIDVAQGYTFVPSPPVPVDVVSRKTHETSPTPTDFDIHLLPPNPAIEMRRNTGADTTGSNVGRDHRIVFTFPVSVTVSGTPNCTASGGATCTLVNTSGSIITADLQGVTDVQPLTITLTNVNGAGNVSVLMNVLAGDTNEDKRTNVGDTNQTKSRSGQLTDGTNFKSDVNVDGRINVGDTNFVKAHSGHSLP